MKIQTTERNNGVCSLRKTGDERQHTPTKEVPNPRVTSRRTPMSTSFLKIGLVSILFVCLIIFSSVKTVESRRASRRNRDKTHGENDIVVDEGRKSRAGRQRGGSGRKILKTSEEARIITEKRYLPDDWCKTHPVKQTVRTKNGCEGTFINNFCYGQCNSFYIPRDLSGDEGEPEAFKSCSFCKPYKTERVMVRLKCPGKRKRGRKIKRWVNKIKECRCIAVPDIDSHTPAPEEPVPATSSSEEASAPAVAGESR